MGCRLDGGGKIVGMRPIHATITAGLTSLALFVALALAAPAGLHAAPTKAYMRAEGTNPTITQKVLAYDRWVRANHGAPDVLLLGTSRSVMIDPRYIRSVAGKTSFNAGISNGAARELEVMASYADLRTPGTFPQLVVFLDLEAFDKRIPTRRVLDYQRRLDAAHAACPDPRECRTDWQRAARALAVDALRRQPGGRPFTETQRPDGRQINGNLQKLEAAGADMDEIRRLRIRERVGSYGPRGFHRLYPRPQRAFERMLALANARDVRPVVVLTGMHPECIRICGRAGWSDRRREVRAYLRSLEGSRSFRTLDFSYPATWKGSGRDFLDEIHLRSSGANLIVDRLEQLHAFDRATPPFWTQFTGRLAAAVSRSTSSAPS